MFFHKHGLRYYIHELEKALKNEKQLEVVKTQVLPEFKGHSENIRKHMGNGSQLAVLDRLFIENLAKTKSSEHSEFKPDEIECQRLISVIYQDHERIWASYDDVKALHDILSNINQTSLTLGILLGKHMGDAGWKYLESGSDPFKANIRSWIGQ